MGAAYLVEGSVARAGTRIRVSARLTDVVHAIPNFNIRRGTRKSLSLKIARTAMGRLRSFEDPRPVDVFSQQTIDEQL